MHFDLITLLFNPFILMFITVITGVLFGKVRFGRFNFGTSGALFTGLVIGWAVYKYGEHVAEGTSPYVGAAQKMLDNEIIHDYFFNVSLIIFVAAVGLLAAKDIGFVVKKYGVRFIVLGLLITFVGAGATYAATGFIHGSNAYEVAGVYTGALTSSPGLGGALETARRQSSDYAEKYDQMSYEEKTAALTVIDDSGGLTVENTPTLSKKLKRAYIQNAVAGVGIGHAIGYPIGVIVVIFAMNFYPKIFRIDLEHEKRMYRREMLEARRNISCRDLPVSSFSLISFIITCLVGYLVGSIEVYMGPLGYFSLSSTGGVLIVALILGYIGKIGPLSFRMDTVVLSFLREFRLAFFLAIVGLKYGFNTFDALMGSGLALALTSLFVGALAMFAGFAVGRYAFKLNWMILSGALCGGMTSTPGLGAAIDATESDEPASGYGATYPFALLGMILFTILLHRLPIL